MPLVLLILGLAVLMTVTALTFTARRRERRELRALAARCRLNFTPDDLIDLHERYYRLSIIRRGHSRFAWNLLYGSTEEGLVSIFCYRCNLGFGVNQTDRSWWLAVVETSAPHAAWQAERQSSVDPFRSEKHERSEGPLVVRADEESTLERLPMSELRRLFEAFPLVEHAEVRRQLVCVAGPRGGDIESPQRLLEAARALARLTAEL